MSDNTPEVTVADILDRAADLIEPEGAWTQGEYAKVHDLPYKGFGEIISGATCRCAIGAIIAATPGAAHVHEVEAGPAVEALVVTLGLHRGGVPSWNDAPERTQAEVVAALRQAAAAERATGAA